MITRENEIKEIDYYQCIEKTNVKSAKRLKKFVKSVITYFMKKFRYTN